MKKVIAVFLIAAFCLLLMGCYTHIHQIGNGAQTGVKVEKKQWYILWGLIPLNDVDSQQMAGGATDYTIKTQHSFVDVLISIVTGYVTIYPKTVTVTK